MLFQDHEKDEEEEENDKIVLESFLNWESEGANNFQYMLQQQSQDLNKEIIELLILWEDEKFDSKVMSKPISRHSTSPLILKKDTTEIIDLLTKLDHEFDIIDSWLEKQTELFQDVSSKLSLIEGTLYYIH
jgi:hypothetical protein